MSIFMAEDVYPREEIIKWAGYEAGWWHFFIKNGPQQLKRCLICNNYAWFPYHQSECWEDKPYIFPEFIEKKTKRSKLELS